MQYKIQQHKHKSFPIRIGFWIGRDCFRWLCRFDRSARYKVPEPDDKDVNKLVGIGYFPGLHHKNSVRIGWRYNSKNDKIDLYAYAYVQKERIVRYITSVEIDRWIDLRIDVAPQTFLVTVNKSTISVQHNGVRGIQYFLRPYFGGTWPAPHDIKITVKPY